MAVDDEPLALALLEDNISKVPFLERVASCSNGMQALETLKKTEVDLIFLDIQMPGLTGLQFLKSLPLRPMVVLITAYEQYALDGFNLDVVDYLVKPVAFERFLKACNKALDFYQLKQANPVVAHGVNAPPANPDFFFVNAEYGLVKIITADIVLIEGLKDYLKIRLADGKNQVIRMSMKSIEEKLAPGRFFRIHKSYIVNLAQVTAVRKNSVFLGTQELPLSDHYKDALLAAIDPGK